MTKKQGELSQEQFNKLATKEDLKLVKDDLKLVKNDLKKFATKDDLKKFATKDDLKKFATKDDLKKFATKDDLKKYATKKDLKKYATKDALKLLDEKVDKIAISLLKTKDDVEDIKEKMATKEDVNKILTAVDGITQNFKKTDEELSANQDAHNSMQKEINETRTKVGLKVKSRV